MQRGVPLRSSLSQSPVNSRSILFSLRIVRLKGSTGYVLHYLKMEDEPASETSCCLKSFRPVFLNLCETAAQ
jgi:hypothetical protein